jgi:hypothetical protein
LEDEKKCLFSVYKTGFCFCIIKSGMIFLAFRQGCMSNYEDYLIMQATRGDMVHVEIVWKSDSKETFPSVACGAWEGDSPAFKARDPKTFMIPSQYIFLQVPIRPDKEYLALEYLNTLIESKLEYHFGWECVVPEKWMRIFEQDLSVSDPPNKWKKVFCSQVALLFLKKLQSLQVLLESWEDILPMYTYHCCPTELYKLCVQRKMKQFKNVDV